MNSQKPTARAGSGAAFWLGVPFVEQAAINQTLQKGLEIRGQH